MFEITFLSLLLLDRNTHCFPRYMLSMCRGHQRSRQHQPAGKVKGRNHQSHVWGDNQNLIELYGLAQISSYNRVTSLRTQHKLKIPSVGNYLIHLTSRHHSLAQPTLNCSEHLHQPTVEQDHLTQSLFKMCWVVPVIHWILYWEWTLEWLSGDRTILSVWVGTSLVVQ